MNPSTGEIRTFDTEQAAREAGFTEPLTTEQETQLRRMTTDERIAWAKREAAKRRPPTVHPSGMNRATRRRKGL